MQPEQKLCPFCKSPVAETFYFCPNCGKNIKPVPLSTSFLKQIGVYAVSILLPPLGFWPGIKYLKKESKTAKMIGTIAIILTIISTVISVWLLKDLVNQINQLLNSQLKSYQYLGF